MKYDMPTEKHLILNSRSTSKEIMLEQEKKIRRKIANSNERRRMQSINAGFQSLRALLPHPEGEKLSKAAILQNAADYLYQLKQDKARLLEHNSQLSRKVLLYPHHLQDSDGSCSGSPVTKGKKREFEDCIDEGIGNSSPSRQEHGTYDLKKELIDLRIQLEHERTVRSLVEEKLFRLESQLHLAESSDEASDQNRSYYPSVSEEVEVCSLSKNLDEESNLRSPQSQVSSQDLEISQEMSNPKFSNLEVPQDFSRKSVIQSADGLSISNANITNFVFSNSNFCIRTIPVDFNITSQAVHKTSTSRQNLEVIVEAIKHVEGEHMFREDSTCTQSNLTDLKLNHEIEHPN